MQETILLKDLSLFAENFEWHEDLRDKTFLITGATGLVGATLCKCLLALNSRYGLNLRVIAPVRDVAKAHRLFGRSDEHLLVRSAEVNALSPADVPEKIDYLIHLAAPTASAFFVQSPVETLQTVVEGTAALLAFARQKGVASGVYVSSVEVYGAISDDSVPLTEEQQGYIDPLSSRSSYSLGKRTAECYVHAYAEEYGLPFKTARLTQTFGPGIDATDNRVFAQFARSAHSGHDIILHTQGESAKPYCYSIDAVGALLFILLKGANGAAYNVANDQTYISVREMAEFVRANFAPDIRVRIEPDETKGYAPTTRLKLDTTALRRLGWRPLFDLRTMFENLIRSLD